MANVIESEVTRFWLTDHCPDAAEFVSTSSFPNHSMFTRNSVDSLGRDGAAVHVLFLRLIRYGVHQFTLQDQFDAGTGVATIKLVTGSGSLHDCDPTSFLVLMFLRPSYMIPFPTLQGTVVPTTSVILIAAFTTMGPPSLASGMFVHTSWLNPLTRSAVSRGFSTST